MNSAAKPAGMSGVRHRQHQDKVADLEEGGHGMEISGIGGGWRLGFEFQECGQNPIEPSAGCPSL
jgi:hypothetical protein